MDEEEIECDEDDDETISVSASCSLPLLLVLPIELNILARTSSLLKGSVTLLLHLLTFTAIFGMLVV